MKNSKRVFISVYFEDALVQQRKKRDVTLAFSENDALYLKCKQLGSSGIKQIIGVNSYRELVNAANKEGRSLGNYIKYQLKRHFENE